MTNLREMLLGELKIIISGEHDGNAIPIWDFVETLIDDVCALRIHIELMQLDAAKSHRFLMFERQTTKALDESDARLKKLIGGEND